MTAQKLTQSSSTDSFKTFKQALQQKVQKRQIELHRREREAMANTQQQAVADAAPVVRNQVWGNANGTTPRDTQTGREVAVAATARARPTTVEPESSDRHLSTMVVTSGHPAAAAADGEVLPAALLVVSGAAIPVSPPSSPTHVASQHDVASARARVPGEVVPSTDNAIVEVKQSPSGGEGPAALAGVEIPPSSLPAPALTRASVAESKEGDGGAESATGSGISPSAATPVPPVRLGRGRKLCPNCHALTKSAVKQCRECKHFFSPASSRLRPPAREPKENDEDTIPARRRLRPSQRLIEYELYEAGSQATGGGDVDSSSRSARRPLANYSPANTAGGGANHHVLSGGGGGGRPAEADAGAVTKKSVVAGGAGGARSVTDGSAHAPKRSHKRKVPLPPGVAPPKRRKGAAAAARAQATAAVTAQAGHGSSLPPSTLPYRQRVAQNLSAAHVRVPTSPELGPAATPAGPLLFLSSAASLSPMEDDADVWPPPAPPTAQQQEQPAAASAPAALAFDPLSLSPPRVQPLQRSLHAVPLALDIFGRGTSSMADLLLMDDGPKQRDDVIDISVESQGKDPFEGVQLWLEGESNGVDSASSALSSAGVPSDGVQTAFPTAVGGVAVEQRVFSLDESLELLDDDDLMWGPVRTSSANDNGNITSLWPETSNGSVSSSLRRSPSPDNHAFLNFEHGAALASAVALGICRNGGGATAETEGGDLDLQGLLLGDSGCSLEPLSFDITRGERAAAAASTNSGSKAGGVFRFSGAPRGGAGGATPVVALSPSSVPRTVAS